MSDDKFVDALNKVRESFDKYSDKLEKQNESLREALKERDKIIDELREKLEEMERVSALSKGKINEKEVWKKWVQPINDQFNKTWISDNTGPYSNNVSNYKDYQEYKKEFINDYKTIISSFKNS